VIVHQNYKYVHIIINGLHLTTVIYLSIDNSNELDSVILLYVTLFVAKMCLSVFDKHWHLLQHNNKNKIITVFSHSRGRNSDDYTLVDEAENSHHDEILYCADTQTDSCAYFEGEEQCDCNLNIYDESDQDGESDDGHSEQTDDNYGEWQTSATLPVSTISCNRLDETDNDDEEDEGCHKEMQSLL